MYWDLETTAMYGISILVPPDIEWDETCARLKAFKAGSTRRVLAGGQSGESLFPYKREESVSRASQEAFDVILGQGHGLKLLLQWTAPFSVHDGHFIDPKEYFEKYLQLILVFTPSESSSDYHKNKYNCKNLKEGVRVKDISPESIYPPPPAFDTRAVENSIRRVLDTLGLETVGEIG